MTASTPPSQDYLKHIKAVFRYLDTLLNPELIELSKKIQLGERSYEILSTSPLKELSELINHTFRLQLPECPLRQALAEFKLFHRDHMADALAAAYGQRNAGKDFRPALNWKFSVPYSEYLIEEDILTHIADARADKPFSPWPHFRRFHQEGDQFFFYNSPTSSGYILLRENRLVWEHETLRILPAANPDAPTIEELLRQDKDSN